MVTDIPRLVRDLVPLARSAGRMSVACVHTTRPKYLVFESDASRPSFVVQFGAGEQLARTHQALRHLHPQLPDMVAESLVCAPFKGDEYVHVQTGLAGLPWFRVADLCRTRLEWVTLVQRCMGVLTRLQAAVGAHRQWTRTLHPGQQLRERLQSARLDIVNAHSRTIACWADALDAIGPVAGAWQHGDFSVNNLLIDESGIGVIDFDEFGDTMMPLHDEMGLALSFPLSQPGVCPLTIRESLQLCLAPAAAAGTFGTDATRALLLHHLLWRIEQCHDWPQRDRLRATLTGYLHELIVHPERLLGETDFRPAVAAL